MSKSLQEISKIINEFVEKRGWGKYNTPNNMISSILIELGELAEHYQWRFDYEEWDEEKKKIVGFEFVDVFFLLMGLANRSGIDIEKYFDMKIPLLDKKFEVGGDHHKAHEEYRKTGKNKLYK